MQRLDVIVVGAGMAGASAAYELSASASVAVLEREQQPGYHATGRSAAAFIPSYGHSNQALLNLTLASRNFLERPDPGFSLQMLLRQRGLLTIGRAEQSAALAQECIQVRAIAPQARMLQASEVVSMVPALQTAFAQQALFEPEVFDIDVDALHQGYLRGLRARGGGLHCGIDIARIDYRDGRYVLETNQGSFAAPRLVNAGGAWADELATQAQVAPIGLQPLRRTAVLVDPPPAAAIQEWPLLLAQDGSFYAKPDAGALLLSPADEHPSPPTDAQPEELDIAYAVHHAQQALKLDNPRVRHSWAGLRSFAPDRTPVIGFDPDHPSFFWLCGQGGHGIQTAPACARLTAALVLEGRAPSHLDGVPFDPAWVTPARLRGHR